MTLNAKPIILWDNLFNRSTPTATDTASGFDPLNLIDWRRHTLWKAASAGTKYITGDLNTVEDPGFESGGWASGWTQNDAVLATGGQQHTGTWAARLDTPGGVNKTGPSQVRTVDATKVYTVSAWLNLLSLASGLAWFYFRPRDSEGNVLGVTWGKAFGTAGLGYLKTEETLGPVGSGATWEFPPGTVDIVIRSFFSSLSGAGIIYMDDVLLYEATAPDRWAMVNHNFWDANATVSLESSDADVASGVGTWTERVAGFTPDDNKAIWKTFALIGTPQRAWRIKIVTANIAPYLGMIFLGAKLEFPRYMVGEWDPLPYPVRGTTGTSEGGNWLGATPQPYVSENTLMLRNITDAFVRDTFGPVFNNHIRQLLPWMLMWDETNHDADVFLMRLRDGARKSFPYTPTLRTITLEVNTVVEE